MNPLEHPAPHPSEPAAQEEALEALASPSRQTRESTKQLMSTPLYRSWLAFMAAAKQQDGTYFSDTSRTNLRSLGTGLLSSLLERYPPGSECVDYDAHLRGVFGFLNRSEAESLITHAAGTATFKQTQLRSVLVNLIGPWAESQGIELPEGFPRPAARHPVEARLDEIPSFRKLCATLDNLVQSGKLTASPAASVKRKVILFLRFVYTHVPSREWHADHFNKHLTENFDRLVGAYLNSGAVSAPSLNTARSALNRYFRSSVTGAPPSADFETARRGPANHHVQPGQISDAPQILDASPPDQKTKPQVVAPQVDPERYDQVLEAALTAIGRATKLSRCQLAGLSLNEIRLSSPGHPCLVRVFMPEVSPRIPRSWLHICERAVHEALEVYQKQRRLAPAVRHSSFFFINSKGEPLETTPPKGPAKKHRR